LKSHTISRCASYALFYPQKNKRFIFYDSHETQEYRTPLCADIMHQITAKSGSKFGMQGEKFVDAPKKIGLALLQFS
jgi:hypothetical protein